MTDAMAHRGPDASGTWSCPQGVLGHRRLSIIDLSSAADQPFHSTDGALTIVFNGEVYNYRDLRRRLQALGHAFRTDSDTEVLLAAYREWGADCLHELEGMFAFALHDARDGAFLLARDRMGVKPLYLYRGDGHLVFASELRALLASGLVPRRTDPDALVDHLRYQTVHAPRTLVHGVTMLEAGHAMRVTATDERTWRWYDPVQRMDPGVGRLPLAAVHAGIRERMARAVEKRMVADVPFGAFLSGGIDSSVVVGLMARASTTPVHTFSVVFDEERFSEERYARLVAERSRTEHTPVRLRPADMLHLLPDALAAMDHPSADGPNTYVVSKVTREAGITMVLSGLGGDEVFAGYPVFARSMALWRRRWAAALPRAVRGALGDAVAAVRPSIATAKLAELLRAPSFAVADTYPVSRLSFRDRDLAPLLRRAPLPANAVHGITRAMLPREVAARLPVLSQVSLAELATYLQNVLLRDTDQMSMAHALEVRVPFLDHHLVEYALAVGDALKYPRTPKQLLTEAMGDLLPHEVVHRPKMGFTLPWEVWMRGELRELCARALARLDAHPQFVPGAVPALWERFLRHDPRVNWSRLWSLVVLGDWMERHGMTDGPAA
jgi:asparagine synthase (glutamine-hydrolysing)